MTLAPDPCTPVSDSQLRALEEMIRSGAYPGVEAIVSDYEQHCCEDDALAGRDTSICTDP